MFGAFGRAMQATSVTFVSKAGMNAGLAEKLGLEPQKFYDIASVSSGQSWSMTSYCPVPGVGPNSPADRDYAGGFAGALMLKDLRLAMAAAAVAASAALETSNGNSSTRSGWLMA
jgi:3-hydroxyisobutyrate dehydrogenase-like beta-hydroxyacid dehydrogenase